MEQEKEDTLYAEVHHLRLVVKLKDDRLKMYENLVREMKQELDKVELRLKELFPDGDSGIHKPMP